MQMLELLKSQLDTGIGIATAVIGLFVLTVRSLFNILSLYDRHWSRRHHKILKELRTGEVEASDFAMYLDNAIYVEGFRIASGISANKITADYLLSLAEVGYWNRHQIKQISKFVALAPDARIPIFCITVWQTASARFSLCFSVFLMLLGGLFGFGVMTKGAGSPTSIFTGFGLEIAFVLAALWIGTPYHSYKIARAFEAYLKQQSDITTENEAQCTNTSDGPAVNRVIVRRAPTAMF